jgi:cardiolipin synthase
MIIVLLIVYSIVLLYTIVRVLLDTPSTPKTLGYLLMVILFPVVGILFYFAFGVNYRHQKSTSLGMKAQVEHDLGFQREVRNDTLNLLKNHPEELGHFKGLVQFLAEIGGEHLSQNKFKLLVNGEAKFPVVLEALENARHFIHMEYYDWENDIRGNQVKETLLKKAGEGLKVRILYDDYASRKIRKNIIRELKAGGVEVYPKIKVKLVQIANRINHRDHRKIIIIDGTIGFVGGINISDRYDNSIDTGLFWRDTHVKFTGSLTKSLQRHFLISWNASAKTKLDFQKEFYPDLSDSKASGISGLGQMVAGGPIYPQSNIMLSYLRIFTLAKEKLYITNPYFIPSESIVDSLKQASISGVDVRLMVPEKSDSAVVGAASRFYFEELLEAGVRIFLYKKGFVHAKTVVADSMLSVVGTANMDIRSFDLNFEIMSVIYGGEFAKELEGVYFDDLKECREINADQWNKNGILKRLWYAVARLISSFL